MVRVDIVEYTKQDLRKLLADERFWGQPKLPITKRRVISHVSNLRADDEDTVLITASDKGQLVAYVGILPDRLMSESQTSVKFGWLTTWWVDKGSENRLAATMVLFKAMKKYSNRIAASSPSIEAKRVYDATNRFQQCAQFDRSYFILALPPSVPVLSPITRWASGAKNRLIYRRKLRKHGLDIWAVDSLNGTLESFINKWAVGDPLARDSSYWRWVLAYPWMSPSSEDEATQKRYAFSAFAKDFKQIPILVRRRGAIVAFLAMTLRDGRLSLKYAYYNPGDIAIVTVALQAAVADVNPWLFISADAALSTALKQDFAFYLARQRKSSEIYATKVLPLSIGTRSQFGTGDSIFT